MKQKNFILTVENLNSPVIITVPHGGMRPQYGSWLSNFFIQRTKSDDESKNNINGEKIVLGYEGPVLNIACDILLRYQANIVAGLLPRNFVDYNRFIPEIAYADPKIKPFYLAYHNAIDKSLERLIKIHKKVLLFDLHGFGKQPIDGKNFDIIIGTSNGESSPNNFDRFFYYSLSDKYSIFCANLDGLPSESEQYKGDTTNLYYSQKYGIDGMLVETAPRFRKGELSKENGQNLSNDFALFFKKLENEIKLF